MNVAAQGLYTAANYRSPLLSQYDQYMMLNRMKNPA